MRRRRAYLWLVGVMWTLTSAALGAGVLRLCRAGLARRAAGDVAAVIYSRELFSRLLTGVLPLFALSLGLAVAGWALGVQAEARAFHGAVRREKLALAGNGRGLFGARAALLLLAAICLIAGTLNGGARDVLYKAINICTECVGLG